MIKIPNPPARALSFTLAAVAFLSLAAPSTAEDYSRRILWANAEHTKAAFLPQAILDSTPIDQLPQDDYGALALRNAIDRAKDPVWGRSLGVYTLRQECAGLTSEPLPPGTSRGAKWLLDWARDAGTVAVGKIIQLVPGWASSTGRISQMVYLSVEDPIRGAGPTQVPTGVFGFQHPTEELQAYGFRLCARTGISLQPLEVGDHLLVIGRMDEVEPWLFHPTTVHRVVGELIKSAPYPDVKDLEDQPLAAFRASLLASEVKP